MAKRKPNPDNPPSAVCSYCGTRTTDLTTLKDHGCCRDCFEKWQWGELCLECGEFGGQHDPECEYRSPEYWDLAPNQDDGDDD